MTGSSKGYKIPLFILGGIITCSTIFMLTYFGVLSIKEGQAVDRFNSILIPTNVTVKEQLIITNNCFPNICYSLHLSVSFTNFDYLGTYSFLILDGETEDVVLEGIETYKINSTHEVLGNPCPFLHKTFPCEENEIRAPLFLSEYISKIDYIIWGSILFSFALIITIIACILTFSSC